MLLQLFTVIFFRGEEEERGHTEEEEAEEFELSADHPEVHDLEEPSGAEDREAFFFLVRKVQCDAREFIKHRDRED